MKQTKIRYLKGISGFLFLVYVLAVIYFMFLADSFNRVEGMGAYRYNLQLFQEIKRFPSMWNVHGPWWALVNLMGNVVVFMPFGFFLPMLRSGLRNGLGITILTFLFSLCVETMQLVFKIGVFDVDDLLLNTIGGMIGYIIFYIIHRVYIHIYQGRIGEENAKKTRTV